MRDGEEICEAFKEAMMDLMSSGFTKTRQKTEKKHGTESDHRGSVWKMKV